MSKTNTDPTAIEALEAATDSETIMVAIYTDGMGTFQAQCLGCAWRGRWYRSEQRAAEQAGHHLAHLEAVK